MKRNSILVIITFLISSCLNNDTSDTNSGPCGDLSNQPKFYDIQNFTTKNYIYNGSEQEPYSAWNVTPTTINEPVNAKKYVIELKANSNFTLVENKQYKLIDVSFFKSAIACSPIPPATYENISLLNITSDADFSSDYPAGSNLNNLFFVKKTSGRGVNSKYDSFMLYNKNININEFLLANPPGMEYMHMMLSKAPSMSKTHNFKIEYMHTDGEFFEIYLKAIIFQ